VRRNKVIEALENEQLKAEVPEVLLSGNHERIRRWRLEQSLARTRARRPDLLNRLTLDSEQQAILARLAQDPPANPPRKPADDDSSGH